MNVREPLLKDQSKYHAHHHSSKCELTLVCTKFKQLPIDLPKNNLAFGSLQNKDRPVNICQIVIMNLDTLKFTKKSKQINNKEQT
jgi:hypothetical protein